MQILREYVARAGLSAGFTVADEQARLAVAASMTGSQRAGRRLLASADPGDRDALVKALTARDPVDLDGLVAQPVALLREDPSLATALACCVQDRWHPDGQDIRTHLRVAKKCR